MQNISSIKTRILEYIEFKGITKYEFYKNSKITRSVLDKDSGISETNIAKFIAYEPNINILWLITGEGEMFLDPELLIHEPSATYKTAKTSKIYPVPLYNLDAVEGLSALFKNNINPLNYIRIPSLPKCDGAVFITGDSMYPFLKSGDIVMYKEINNIAENLIWGEMYLVSIDMDGEEYVSVKWIQKSSKGKNYIKLVSENEHHEAKEVPLNRILALALVKASIHIKTMH